MLSAFIKIASNDHFFVYFNKFEKKEFESSFQIIQTSKYLRGVKFVQKTTAFLRSELLNELYE